MDATYKSNMTPVRKNSAISRSVKGEKVSSSLRHKDSIHRHVMRLSSACHPAPKAILSDCYYPEDKQVNSFRASQSFAKKRSPRGGSQFSTQKSGSPRKRTISTEALREHLEALKFHEACTRS
jgi:hypothetical protein